MMSNNQKNNPWKALLPYEKEDAKMFYGRDEETAYMTSLIEYNQMVILYGKSGVGKSSLLNAGVYPRLELGGMKPYTIRLASERDINDKNIPFSKIILSYLSNRDINVDCHDKDIFRTFFSNYTSFGVYGEQVTPVIILDQFEELLLQEEYRTELLLKQIVSWINNNDPMASDCHFVISIREDDLYLLEDVIDKNRLNSLKSTRYRLGKIGYKGAKDIISKPGEKYIEDDKVVDGILHILNEDKMLRYEASELSLLCYLLFESMSRSGKQRISLDLVNNFGKISVKEYYLKILSDLNLNREYVDILENEFITEDGRKSFVAEDKFRTLFPKDICERLSDTNSRYKIFIIANGKVEIIHDLLAKAVKDARDEHDKESIKAKQVKEKWILYSSLAPIFLILMYAFYKILPSSLFFLLRTANITNALEFLDYPDISYKFLFLALLPIFWIVPYYVLKGNGLLSNIDAKKTFIQASCLYGSVFLLFLWTILYMQSLLSNWALGFRVFGMFPLFSYCLLYIFGKRDTNGIHLFITISIVFILAYRELWCAYIFLWIWLVAYKGIKYGYKLAVILLFGILCLSGSIIYPIIMLVLLYVALTFKEFKKQIHKGILYSILFLGMLYIVGGYNPLYLFKFKDYNFYPYSYFIGYNQDSVYVNNAWKNEPYIDWPIVKRENTHLGLFPVKNIRLSHNRINVPPFIEYFPGEGYDVYHQPDFYDGINNIDLILQNKLKKYKGNSDINYIETTLYPLKSNVAKLFSEVMSVISNCVRNDEDGYITCRNLEDLIYFSKIDTLCNNFLREFGVKFKESSISKSEVDKFYTVITCELMNSMAKEYAKEGNIVGTLNIVPCMVYYMLCDEDLYKSCNIGFNVNITIPAIKINESFKMDGVIDSLEEKVNFFNLITSLAINERFGYFGDLHKSDSYLLIFTKESLDYLLGIMQNEYKDNRLYRTFFDTVLIKLAMINMYNSSYYLESMYTIWEQDSKRYRDEYETYAKNIDSFLSGEI